jgi:hypothetical protein
LSLNNGPSIPARVFLDDEAGRERILDSFNGSGGRLALPISTRRGQADNDPSAAIRSVLGRDRATVCFDDRSNDGQAHSHALLFSGKEVVENLIRLVLR